MYNYTTQKKNLFTEEGQVLFLKIRDNAQLQLKGAGAFRMDCVLAGCTGDGWDMMACVDRLVELQEVYEVTAGRNVPGQYRIFSSRKDRP